MLKAKLKVCFCCTLIRLSKRISDTVVYSFTFLLLVVYVEHAQFLCKAEVMTRCLYYHRNYMQENDNNSVSYTEFYSRCLRSFINRYFMYL